MLPSVPCFKGRVRNGTVIGLLVVWIGLGAGCGTAPFALSEHDGEPQTVFQKLANLEVSSDRLYLSIAEQADVVGYSRQLQLESDLADPLTPSDMEGVAQAFMSSLKVMLFDLAPAKFWENHLAQYYVSTLSAAEARTLVETYERVVRMPSSRLQELRGNFVTDRVPALLPEVRARSYRFKVFSKAMAPTLLPGDHVIVNQAAYRAASPQQGDVVVFRFPDDHGPLLMYRVIGVPGDRIQVRDQRVSVNGVVLMEPYVQHTDESILTRTVRDHLGPLTVPPESYFVMGDNREWSLDSRFLGSISQEMIVGQAVFIFWSVDPGTKTPRWGHLNQPVR
jgi:signal peptidase I